MNWDAIGALGELVGGVAVIGTLIYLASQIRQNTKINASAIRQNFYDYTTRQMLHGTDSLDFSTLMARLAMTDDELSPGEDMQMIRMFQAVFVGYQGAFIQYQHNALSEDDWMMCRSLLRSYWLFPGKGMARMWGLLKTGGFLDDGFVAECELLREEAQQYVRDLEKENLKFEVS